MDEKSEVIEMTADIVSAYVGNNSVAAADLPNLIQSVHRALAGISSSGLPGRRPEIQVAQASPSHEVQYEPRRIPREVGSSEGLPYGCAELC